jgi:hypothetical protein
MEFLIQLKKSTLGGEAMRGGLEAVAGEQERSKILFWQVFGTNSNLTILTNQSVSVMFHNLETDPEFTLHDKSTRADEMVSRQTKV